MQHDWIKSTLGHGETMCSRCFITNREAAVLGVTNSCDVPPPVPEAVNDNAALVPVEPAAVDDQDYDYDDDGDCWNCGGEGRVNDCIDGCCVEQDDPWCPYCSKRCDICNPAPKKQTDDLREVLGEALNAAKNPHRTG